MSKQRILDYDEAKQRLLRLEQDQEEIRTLVSKLRTFAESAEDKIAAIEGQHERSLELLRNAEGMESKIESLTKEHSDRGEKLHSEFERQASESLRVLNQNIAEQAI